MPRAAPCFGHAAPRRPLGSAASARARAAAPPPATGWRARLMVLLAAITVSAMAAPGIASGAFAALPGPAAEYPAGASDTAAATAKAAAAALPFERPGMSFPGSAFFYLADPPGPALLALPTTDPLSPGSEDGRPLGSTIDAGTPAKPFFSGGTGLAHARALECLAQAVWYEAASESEGGQRAVAQVVLNRVAHPAWPASVCGVVYQGSDRETGCQFTFTCDGSLARRPGGTSWARARRIASEALAGAVYAPVGLATHYHTLWVAPRWAPSLDHIGTIGAHRFYRNRGAGGAAGAFTLAYAGIEPVVSGRMSPLPAISPVAAEGPAEPARIAAIPPLRVAREEASVRGKGASGGASAVSAASTPGGIDPVSAAYPGTGSVRPEYARAGAWKSAPEGGLANNPAVAPR